MSKLVVDGKDAVFGRMASVVAKDLLKACLNLAKKAERN